MKRKHEMFWNNNYEWLNTWYGITTDSDRYRGYDFVEANGRVFLKTKMATICGETKQQMIGFVKPMSDKLTILEVIPEQTLAMNGPSISLSGSHIYWIAEQIRGDNGIELLLAKASVKYSDKYNQAADLFLKHNIHKPTHQCLEILRGRCGYSYISPLLTLFVQFLVFIN